MASFISVAKYSIFVSNFFYFILGVYNFMQTNQLIHLRSRYDLGSTLNLPIGLYSVAFVLIVIASVVGYFGAHDENPKLIRAYALMILLGLLLQISLNIVIFKKTGPSVALKIIQRDVIAKYNEPDFLYDREAIERLQQENSCCGVFSYFDYGDLPPEKYPSSCCGKYQKNISKLWGSKEARKCDLDELKATKGCGTLFLAMFKQLYNYGFDALYIVVLVFIYTLQTLTLALSWTLSVKLSNRTNNR